MDRFVQHEKPTEIKILDLAAGSGEATEVSSLSRASIDLDLGSCPR